MKKDSQFEPDGLKIILKCVVLFVALWPFSAIIDWVMNVEDRVAPAKYDAFLFLIDKTLIGHATFDLARAWRGFPASVSLMIYSLLAPAMIFWYWVNEWRGSGRKLLAAYAWGYIIGAALYMVVPSCGPIYAFGREFATSNPMPGLALMPIRNWPNAIPSLHVTTACVFVLCAGEKLALKLLAWMFLLATALSTLVIGEHYLIDLVVAIPFAAFSVCIAEQRIPRATSNFLMVIAWLLGIRFATSTLISHTGVLRICVLGTVAASLYSAFSERDPAEFQASALRTGKVL